MGPLLLGQTLDFTSLLGESRGNSTTELRGAVSQTQTVIGCIGSHLETMRGCIPAFKKIAGSKVCGGGGAGAGGGRGWGSLLVTQFLILTHDARSHGFKVRHSPFIQPS